MKLNFKTMLTFEEFFDIASKKTITFSPTEVSQMQERGGDCVLEMGSLQEDGSFAVTIDSFPGFGRDDNEELFEMSNLGQRKTGLPFVIWASVRGNAQHDIRIEVSRNIKALPSEMVTVAIRPTVRVMGGSLTGNELNLVKKFVDLNRNVLIQYWNSEIETEDLLAAIRPVQ